MTDARTTPCAAITSSRRARPVPASAPPLPPLTRRRSAALFGDDRGAATAEYAIATMATVAGLKRIYTATHCDSQHGDANQQSTAAAPGVGMNIEALVYLVAGDDADEEGAQDPVSLNMAGA
ncbi:DUF4244 domain-containing protein [Microbacterium resistens]|uniref:DUF4244 domain-containing protein n=1 Tax=Microbacterium resistens TaxID=156977 RepID=UPI000834FF70|nr:DUF4244 domain-containing protein [Microbacterium resistens]